MKFSINTFDKNELQLAAQYDLGLEIEEYLWTYTSDELKDKFAGVSALMRGFHRFSFHGTAVSRNVEQIHALSDEQLINLYNDSYQVAKSHGISKIVFHSNYLSTLQRSDVWIKEKSEFWKRFLEGKASTCSIFIENFIDDTPQLLLQLMDAVADPRFKICLDTGHANCNSNIPVTHWIKTLGYHIGHAHLHNNDGIADRHWPLDRGTLDFGEVIDCFSLHVGDIDYVLECNLTESMPFLSSLLRCVSSC